MLHFVDLMLFSLFSHPFIDLINLSIFLCWGETWIASLIISKFQMSIFALLLFLKHIAVLSFISVILLLLSGEQVFTISGSKHCPYIPVLSSTHAPEFIPHNGDETLFVLALYLQTTSY
jgi:hypothetical protein